MLKWEKISFFAFFFLLPPSDCLFYYFGGYKGELFEILEDDHRLTEAEVQKIARQLVRSLQYLHTHRIIHRFKQRKEKEQKS
jgi:serine/threonine protein kinase